jgi:hypothetical protein
VAEITLLAAAQLVARPWTAFCPLHCGRCNSTATASSTVTPFANGGDHWGPSWKTRNGTVGTRCYKPSNSMTEVWVPPKVKFKQLHYCSILVVQWVAIQLQRGDSAWAPVFDLERNTNRSVCCFLDGRNEPIESHPWLSGRKQKHVDLEFAITTFSGMNFWQRLKHGVKTG